MANNFKGKPTDWVASILPKDAVLDLLEAVSLPNATLRTKRLDEVTEAIKKRYPSYFRKGAKKCP